MITSINKILLLMFLALIASGCLENISGEQSKATDKDAFDIKGLIESQLEILEGKKLKKVVNLDGQNEELLIITDSASLHQDLLVFEDLDLNKPGMLENYSIDQNSEERVYKKIEKNGPDVLRISYQGGGVPSLISAEHMESNILYDSFRKYKLVFDDQGTLNEYEFSGFQKLIFQDTVYFSISAKIQ